MEDKVKVHVTKEQREELEFLVKRRINDIRISKKELVGEIADELRRLGELYRELRQAGT